jgi:hypothetical protein
MRVNEARVILQYRPDTVPTAHSTSLRRGIFVQNDQMFDAIDDSPQTPTRRNPPTLSSIFVTIEFWEFQCSLSHNTL